MNKNKIGVVTSNTAFANNYGAVLQAYALCKQLECWGYQVDIINYKYANNGAMVETASVVDRSIGARIKYIFSSEASLYKKIIYRLNRGWSIEQALTIPTKGLFRKVYNNEHK